MCGRFVRTATAEDIADLFQLTEVPAVEPRQDHGEHDPQSFLLSRHRTT
jgi:hypothetical protein